MPASPKQNDRDALRSHLLELQDEICAALEETEGQAVFQHEEIAGDGDNLTRPRVLNAGKHIERAAVNLSLTSGSNLPAAATERRPELVGKAFEASSISLIIHPRNPHAPTTHANFRFFRAGEAWWFGGGYDLTPYYGYEEDARHWHQTAADACAGYLPGSYERFKKWCDEYFYLPHRQEPRGIGGLFFDDLNEPDYASCFSFWRKVSSSFLPAYLPILQKRMHESYEERQREWQLVRRGRYVEFNLMYDRGTRYGLQASKRVESILASLPPLVRWEYNLSPESGSEEERLLQDFLRPRDWLG